MGGSKEESIPQEIIYPATFLHMLKKAKNPAEQAFLLFLYLTGSRVSEALNVRYGDFIRTINTKKGKIPVVQLKVLKGKEERIRTIPLWVNWNEGRILGSRLIAWINESYNALLDPEAHKRRVWKHSRWWAWEVCKRVTGVHPHFWRHHRAMYLTTVEKWSEYKLVNYFLWTDPKTSYIYTRARNPEQFLKDLTASW